MGMEIVIQYYALDVTQIGSRHSLQIPQDLSKGTVNALSPFS